MNKKCFCGRKAAWGVIDKYGFMEPGTLCPSHYITWTNSEILPFVIFQRLAGGAFLMKDFYAERERKKMAVIEPPPVDDREKPTLDEICLEAVLAALEANNGQITVTCRELKISKATFYRYLKRNNITLERNLRWKRPQSN